MRCVVFVEDVGFFGEVCVFGCEEFVYGGGKGFGFWVVGGDRV